MRLDGTDLGNQTRDAMDPLALPVIAIGPAMSECVEQVTGQSMMFQLLVDALREEGWIVRVIDSNITKSSAKSHLNGTLTLCRILDYLRLMPKILEKVFLSRRSVVYHTTAQSLAGFLRDMVILWLFFLRGHKIVCQQFGGNYSGFYEKQNVFIRFLIRSSLARSKRIVVEGELVKEQFLFLPDYQQKVCVVPNGLPEQSMQFSEKAKNFRQNETLNLIYLSNMIESKGYWDVSAAVRILVKERRRKVKCRFVGKFMSALDSVKYPDPEDARSAFFNYIKKHDLQEYISYDECLLGDEKHKAFQDSHVFLLPTNYLYEGQPVSVLEAMAHGTVAIATDYRLIPTMVVDGITGYFVPYGKPEEIVKKVEHLIDNPEEFERLSFNSIKRFNEQFRADRYVTRLAGILHDVANNNTKKIS